MDFGQRLNNIFNVLGCSNAEIARLSIIDSSIISRFRTGSRTPRANSKQFLKLCEGLAAFSEKKGLWEQLKGECGLTDTGSKADEISQYLLPTVKNKASGSDNSFSDKLNALMKMTDITNIRLSKALQIDNSLISRFRNGFRTPHKNSSTINELCDFFYKRALSCGYEARLASLLDVPVSKVLKGDEDFLSYFADWLTDSIDGKTINLIDNLLEKAAGKIKTDKIFDFPADNYEKGALKDTASEYKGIEGFKRAFNRFFGTALDNKQPGNIKLYTNVNIEKMIENEAYTDRLRELIRQAALKGSQITYFNDTDMSTEELCANIESWLPLYMTGQVSSYYGRGPVEGRFLNVLLTAPGSSALELSIVKGTEEEGRLKYYTKEEDISYCEGQLQALFQQARPMVQVFDNRSHDKYYYRLGEAADRLGETHKILLSLSIATMPRQLLSKMLTRSGILSSKKEQILYLHDIRTRQFYRELQNGGITEYLVLPEDEALFSGKVKMNMAEMVIDLPVAYTSEEYSEHISSVLTLLKENDNYNIAVLSENLYNNIQILHKEEAGTMLVRSADPTAALWLEQPSINSAFKTYIELLERKSKIPAGNKPAVLNELRKYLI
jgi:hypothetical protein